MASQESTAINDLIQLVQGGQARQRIEEDPVPELFVPAVRVQEQTVTHARCDVPSLDRKRAAKGTPAPQMSRQPVTQQPYVMPHAQPVTQQPYVMPHAQPVTQQPYAQPVTQQPYAQPVTQQPHTQQTHAQPVTRQPYTRQPHVQPYVMPRQPLPTYSAPVSIAQGTPAPVYRVPTHAHVEQDDEQTELWQGTPRPVQHAPTSAVVIPAAQAKPVSNPYIPTRPDLSKLPRELSSTLRYAGLGFLALAAISIGTYLGASSGSSSNTLDERERTIAIMNGELPAPTPTTHVVAPAQPTVRVEATAPAPKVEPIEPIVEPVAEKKEDVIWSPPVVIDSEEIEEIEMAAETRKPTARRASRVAKRAKAVKSVAKIEKPAKAEKKADKKSKEKQDKQLIATEISAPKGAIASNGSGSITINSNRPAMIYLDGRATGKSAPAALVIPAGDHQITLLDPSTKRAKTATVTIAANKSLAISKDFN